MAGQSGIDEVVRLFMHGADSIAFPRALQEGLSDVLKNSDNVDNLADDIVKWRDDALKQGDLSSQAREFLESPTTLLRIKAIPKIQEVSQDLTKAVESNADNIDIDVYIKRLEDTTPLSQGDLESVRSSFDELLKAREDAIKKVMAENPDATRQDVLDQWAKQFDVGEGNSRAGIKNSFSSKSQSSEDVDLLKRIDELEKKGDFSGTDRLYVKLKKRLGIITVGALSVAIADAALDNPLSTELGRVSQKDIPVISSVMDTLSGALALAVDGVSYAMSAPAKFLASTVIGGLEENGKIKEGPEGDNQRALVMLISHVASGNALPAAEIAFGLDISAQDINDAVAKAKSQDLSATEVVQSVYLDLKDRVLENANDKQYGLAGGAFNKARTGIEKKKDELAQTAHRLISDNLTNGGLGAMSAGLSDLLSKNVSSKFNAVSSNLDKLGITGISKIAFQFIDAVADVIGIFSEDAKKSMQSFALSALGIDEKINSLKEAASNNRLVSQFGDKFGIKGRNLVAPELAAEL